MKQIPPLLEATRQAVTAAAAGDLAALEAALDARRVALETVRLEDIPAAERLAASKEGQTLHFLLSGIRRQLREQQGTLEQMKTRLKRSGPPPVAMLDIKA
jgi:hypothetical protein